MTAYTNRLSLNEHEEPSGSSKPRFSPEFFVCGAYICFCYDFFFFDAALGAFFFFDAALGAFFFFDAALGAFFFFDALERAGFFLGFFFFESNEAVEAVEAVEDRSEEDRVEAVEDRREEDKRDVPFFFTPALVFFLGLGLDLDFFDAPNRVEE
jgi:hypothetical protein